LEGILNKGGAYFNDLFCFDIVEAKWQFHEVLDPPSQRTDHTLIQHGNGMYLYGGRDETRIFSDLYKFDFDNFTWIQLENNIEEPRMRFGHTTVKWKNFMYIFGGWDGVATLNDLF